MSSMAMVTGVEVEFEESWGEKLRECAVCKDDLISPVGAWGNFLPTPL